MLPGQAEATFCSLGLKPSERRSLGLVKGLQFAFLIARQQEVNRE